MHKDNVLHAKWIGTLLHVRRKRKRSAWSIGRVGYNVRVWGRLDIFVKTTKLNTEPSSGDMFE